MVRAVCQPLIVVSIMSFVMATPCGAQRPLPAQEDVATLDGIIAAYYDVVSGPAGAPCDVERDRSLHDPNARAIIAGVDSEGRPHIRNLTLSEYHDGCREPRSRGFYEREIHRVTHRFGSVAHVWSTYEWAERPGGPVGGRGINSIHMYHDGTRWWIVDWIFDNERDDNPIPAEFLP